MLTRIKKLYKKYKKYLTKNVLMVVVAISCMGYMNHKINYTVMIQHGMLKYLNKNVSEQQTEKIRNHAIALQQKISDYESVGNDYVDQYVLTAYQSAKELALVGDDSCYFVEKFGDDILNAYSIGVIDGNKMWNKSHTQL